MLAGDKLPIEGLAATRKSLGAEVGVRVKTVDESRAAITTAHAPHRTTAPATIGTEPAARPSPAQEESSWGVR